MSPKTESPAVYANDTPFLQLVEIISQRIDGVKDVNKRAPGLSDLLSDVLADAERDDENKKADFIGFLRRLLCMYKDAPHDNAYQNVLKLYSEDEQDRIEKFVGGASIEEVNDGFNLGPSLGVREEVRKLFDSHHCHIHGQHGLKIFEILKEEFQAHNPFHKFVNDLSNYLQKEDQSASVTVYQDAEFQNWGLNVKAKPQYTCVPTTVAGVQAIIRYAKQADMNVRCAGYRHSWSPVFGRNGQILISMLPLKEVTKLPNFTAVALWESRPNGLEDIEIVDGATRVIGNKLVRIGCAVTNERLRRWCVEGNEVTIPVNVILGETTVGGVNAPICHGAGISHQTVSDIVRKIEYVDANGKLQTITDPNQLRAASGCFGLIGVVTHLTLEFPPMRYAVMKPVKLPVMQAVPPPAGMPDSAIPPALRLHASPEVRARWQVEFERRALQDYYAEWFWFPYLDTAWVNTWSATADQTDVVTNWPAYGKIVLVWLGGFLLNVAQEATTLAWVGDLVRAYATSTSLISHAAMAILPTTEVKTPLPNALHFQRAVQNTRVRDVEVEIPLQPRVTDHSTPDFDTAQRAWWDAIILAYQHERTSPMRMPLEMRVMADSNVILAPQTGNKLGTASIEILTLWSEREAWPAFAQQMIDKWMSYTDREGKPLKTRPHWAKEWAEYKVKGRPWPQKLRDEDYKEEIREFKQVLSDIGKEHGWTLDDAQKRFSNEMFDYLIFSEPHEA